MRTLIYPPFEEFHAFFKFNMFLERYIANTGEDVTIGLPENAIGLTPDAPNIITKPISWFRDQNAAYPEILNNLDDRNVSSFYHYLDGQPNFDKRLVYTNERIINRNEGTTYPLKWYTVDDLTKSFKRDFKWIVDWVRRGKRLRSQTVVTAPFENNVVVVSTRNFEHKQPDTNTHVLYPQLQDLVDEIIATGIEVINIGVPPSPLRPQERYTELNYPVPYDQTLALFERANAHLVFGDNGGYSMQLCAAGNPILLSEEWSKNHHLINESIAEARHAPKFVSEFANRDFNPILETLWHLSH